MLGKLGKLIMGYELNEAEREGFTGRSKAIGIVENVESDGVCKLDNEDKELIRLLMTS